MTLPAFSYSSLKTFETCPRKYEAEKVTKKVKFTDNEHTLYGKELHEAAEKFVRDGVELPLKFTFIKPLLDPLKNVPGEKFCEIKVGLKKEDGRLIACDFFDRECYFRGIADLFILNGAVGFLVDYKTSKNTRYADSRQLALMAACLFAKFPDLKKIKAALIFVVPGELIKSSYTIERKFDIFGELHETITRMKVAHYSGIFNPSPNGLCGKWCGVTSCEHNGKR
jgi:CRISPR/Cas system-associated exonuclease Cas4 (RecB family)